MGLLDEAIREHLELKRRRGADPSEIAHQEQAALDPVYPDEHAEKGAEDLVAEDEPAPPHPDVETAAAPADPVAAAQLGEETAELDMQAVLRAGDAAAEPPERPLDDAAFEWEVPGEQDGERVAEPGPGQERMSFE